MKDAVYRVETTRLILRCWAPEDAEAVKQAEDESRQHLSTFMLWAAKGPQTLDEVVAKLRAFRSWFDTNDDYMYGAFDRATGRIVGGCGLHARAGAGGIEIGYWVHPQWTRKGVATEMAAALTRVAFEVGQLRFVEIRCAKTNTPSAGIPPKLGFVHEATLGARIELPGGTFDDALVFTLHARDYETSAAKGFATSAFDAGTRRLL
ncbi:MAG: acetyltransferase, family [Labilithrix sp.]|nr:acetyltransferase, family [Labilithrix sp.]